MTMTENKTDSKTKEELYEDIDTRLQRAIKDGNIKPEYFSFSDIRPFLEGGGYKDNETGNPARIWLEEFPDQHEYEPEESPYQQSEQIFESGDVFEESWYAAAEDAGAIPELTDGAEYAEKIRQGQQVPARTPEVIREDHGEIYNSERVKDTYDLMQEGVPVIKHPALWWAEEEMFGIPDMIMKASYLEESFGVQVNTEGKNDHYVPVDQKLKTYDQLGKKSRVMHTTQLRQYGYMIGQMQGEMPNEGFIIYSDLHAKPVKYPLNLNESGDMPEELKEFRERYQHIKENGEDMRPWEDEEVIYSMKAQDSTWSHAYSDMARNKYEGGDLRLLPYIGPKQAETLNNFQEHCREAGFPVIWPDITCLEDFREKDVNIDDFPLQELHRVGPSTSQTIRTTLKAFVTGEVQLPHPDDVPSDVEEQRHVDYEYIPPIDVRPDETREKVRESLEKLQDPANTASGVDPEDRAGLSMDDHAELDRHDKVTMIGVYDEDSESYECFLAPTTRDEDERMMFDVYIEFLKADMGLKGVSDEEFEEQVDEDELHLYHWTGAETSRNDDVIDRHQLGAEHILNQLPHVDIKRALCDKQQGLAFPGQMGNGLKEVVKWQCEHTDYDSPWSEEAEGGDVIADEPMKIKSGSVASGMIREIQMTAEETIEHGLSDAEKNQWDDLKEDIFMILHVQLDDPTLKEKLRFGELSSDDIKGENILSENEDIVRQWQDLQQKRLEYLTEDEERHYRRLVRTVRRYLRGDVKGESFPLDFARETGRHDVVEANNDSYRFNEASTDEQAD